MTAATLEDLLDQMALALQRGSLEDLGPLAASITAEIGRMPMLDAGRAEGLRRRAAHNDACLQAAARGVRAAVARIAGIGGAASQMSTYGADGRMFRVGTPTARHSTRL